MYGLKVLASTVVCTFFFFFFFIRKDEAERKEEREEGEGENVDGQDDWHWPQFREPSFSWYMYRVRPTKGRLFDEDNPYAAHPGREGSIQTASASTRQGDRAYRRGARNG